MVNNIIRALLLTTLVTLGMGLVRADEAPRPPTIGQVFGTNPDIARPFDEAFREGLRSLGYIDGRNVILVPRYARGDSTRFAALVGELIALDVDILLIAHTAIPAAMQLTKTIPIVAPSMEDPVGAGYASSLARPGRNLTGLSGLAPETDAKRLEMLKELLPDVRNVLLMFEGNNEVAFKAAHKFRSLARDAGITLRPVGVNHLDDIENALKAMEANRTQALIVYATPFTLLHRGRIIAASTSYKVPVISDDGEFAEPGALLVYSANYLAMWKRSAQYVDKILRGAKASDLPIEQPAKFELIINLRTAKVLGTRIPESLLVRTDRIIR